MLEAVPQRGSLNSAAAMEALLSFDSATVAFATLGSETGANGFLLVDIFRLRFNFRTLLVISFAFERSSFWTGLGFSVDF